MKVKVKYYPRGLSTAEQLAMLGTGADLGLDEAFVILSPVGHGVGVELSLKEAIAMGLTAEDLQAATRESITKEVAFV